MTFVSVNFYLFLIGAIFVYYLLPIKIRWIALLAESLCFYYFAINHGRKLFLMIILVSYLGGILLEKLPEKYRLRQIGLFCSILATGIPLLIIKEGNWLFQKVAGRSVLSIAAPLGLSFFTVQMISYLVDIYNKKITAQKNLLKYVLYISFFPQIIQGPIPRYEQLMCQLETGHHFEPTNITRGFQLILWGFFLKLMIADKASVIVDTVFNNCSYYKGAYVVLAGMLYSIQLYADFQACTKLAQGAASLFGIRLVNNFNHPYFAKSIKEFWGRWHISFSSWLKDYIYIPLGGNRKGKLRKYINLFITFLVSGIWHGSGFRFLVWGGLHAIYQIIGECTAEFRNKIFVSAVINKYSRIHDVIKCIFTFCLVTIAWIIFRANSLRDALKMIRSIFAVYNPWVLINDSVFSLGLSWKEVIVLVLAIVILYAVSHIQECGISIHEKILEQPLVIRWAIYIVTIAAIMIFGTYGYGANAQDFIYGGF